MCVKGKLEPVGAVSPLAFVTVRKLGQFKSVFGRIIDVKNKACAVFRMELSKILQVEAVEQGGVILLRDIAQKEAVIINRESIAGLGMPVPQYLHTVLMPAEAALRDCNDLCLLFAENNF